jgi:hypothetical protein
VPYAWQFANEKASMPAAKGGSVNCFALLSWDNRCLAQTTPDTITGGFVAEQLDRLSLSLARPTVVVLDNAGAGAVRVLPAVVLAAPQHRRSSVAQAQVRVAAALDYADKETLRYRVWLALKDVG